MLRDVVALEVLPGGRLRLRFDDGHEGIVDMAARIARGGIFEPLRDPAYFALARVHPELGTVVWPNGADVCPDVLYTDAGGDPKQSGVGPG